ncbi:MAG: hypothetical protein R6U29_03285, partial [Desulfosudaceae bacterium]
EQVPRKVRGGLIFSHFPMAFFCGRFLFAACRLSTKQLLNAFILERCQEKISLYALINNVLPGLKGSLFFETNKKFK